MEIQNTILLIFGEAGCLQMTCVYWVGGILCGGETSPTQEFDDSALLPLRYFPPCVLSTPHSCPGAQVISFCPECIIYLDKLSKMCK